MTPPLPRVAPVPDIPVRTAMLDRITAVADDLVNREGPESLTMRRVAEALQIKAPSLYKHVDGRAAIEAMVVTDELLTFGARLHDAIDAGADDPVGSLLRAYRAAVIERPHVYRLATATTFPRELLPAGLEGWAGEPFYRVTGDPVAGQSLWAFAHGAATLEADGRFLPGSNLEAMWASAAAIFSGR